MQPLSQPGRLPTVVREIERKYEAGDAGAVARAAVNAVTGTAGVAAVSQQHEQLLDAVYYDTADLRLIGAGITLRRRTGGEDAGWHLKLPAGADARDEIRLPLAAHPGTLAVGAASGTAGMRAATPPPRRGTAVPKELAALVRAYTRDEPLAAVVRIQTSRRTLRLVDQAARILAEIAADHVTAGLVDGSATLSWDEIEAELVTGDAKLLTAIDTRLRKAGARSAATGTKLERALGSRLPPSDAARAGPPTAKSNAGEVVLAYVRDQLAAICQHDPLVRRGEPDAVHKMRVATRRARSALHAFGRVIEWEATQPLCAELKWLATALGRARDAEVLRDRLITGLAAIPPGLVVGPVEADITAHFTAELARAGNAVLRALDGQRYIRLLDDLDALLADPPLSPKARRNAATALARPLRQTHRRLQRALAAVPGAEDRDAAIHAARKAAKRARYAAEAALPALGAKAVRQSTQAKELQQLLGDHHDSVVARTVLLNLAATARADGHDTFTYGLLYQSEVCRAATIEQALRPLGRHAALFPPTSGAAAHPPG
jgi:CHAD domain-containing protein